MGGGRTDYVACLKNAVNILLNLLTYSMVQSPS